MTLDLEIYAPTVLALGAFGGLYLVQLLVADAIAILRKHEPGTPITGGHDDLLWRAGRAHANTTESIGAFILISGFAIAVGSDPAWVNASTWCFVVFRILHMGAYYLDFRIFRSVAFGLSLTSLFVLLGFGMRTALT